MSATRRLAAAPETERPAAPAVTADDRSDRGEGSGGPPAARGRPRRRTWRWLAFLVMLALAFTTLYPFEFLISSAFKTGPGYGANKVSPPVPPTLDNFRAVLHLGGIMRYVKNSIIVTGGGTALVVLFGCMAGFGFAFLSFPLRRALLQLILVIMVLPANILIIPIFKVVLDLGLIDSYRGLILLYLGLQLPFATYMMASFYRAVPTELIDAARMDGANSVQIFFRIGIPLARPAFVTLSTFTFLGLWNDLLFSLLILQSPDNRTLPVAVTLLHSSVQTPNLYQDTIVAAGLVVSIIVPFALFVAFNRQVTRGLTAGALK